MVLFRKRINAQMIAEANDYMLSVRGKVYSFKEDAIRKSEKNFKGKLFVQFVALQMVSYIKKQMDKNACSASIQSSHHLMNLIPLSITSNWVRLIIYRR